MSQGMKAFGQRLRETIKERGVSVQELSKATKIRAVIIEAILSGDRKSLPSDVFVMGYLKAILSHLHADPQPYLDEFKALAREDGTEPEKFRREPDPVPEINSKKSAAAWIVLIAVIFAGSGLYLFRSSISDAARSYFERGTRIDAPPVSPAVSEAPGPGTEEPPSSNAGTAVTVATGPDEPAGKPPREQGLVLTASARSWIDLRGAKGEALLMREVTEGESLDFEGRSFRITMGDPSAVRIYYDGIEVVFDRTRGKVVRDLEIGEKRE